jgi:hypothetical protein
MASRDLCRVRGLVPSLILGLRAVAAVNGVVEECADVVDEERVE